MNDDWLHKIHDRMSDYEIDEPDTLWASIEKKQAENAGQSHTPERHVLMIWVKRAMATAAMLAVVISLGIYFLNNPSELSEVTPKGDIARQVNFPDAKGIQGKQHPQVSHDNKIAQNTTYSCRKTVMARIAPQVGETKTDETGLRTDNNDIIVKGGTQQEHNDSMELAPRNIIPYHSRSDRNEYIASITPRNHHYDRLSFSIYTSGGTGSIFNRQSTGNVFDGVLGPDDASWKDNPMLGILAFNQGKTIKTDIKHRLPIRAGLSFTYNVTDRLGIESGLSYTNLTSDISEGSESHYVTGEQRLHYIGIPVNLKYRIISWQRLDLYGSAGILAEKCVSAKMDKSYILNNRNEKTETENISDKPLQWSANASFGVQCKIIEPIGLYIEPGISYYFKDGTEIRTIYKEKPLNFNLNLGIRFSFGN